MSDDKHAEPPSRTALAKERKAEEKGFAKLAAALVALSPKQLAKLPLSDSALEVIDEARRIRSHAARARQLRAVRRELRDSDNVDAIGAALDAIVNHHGGPAPSAYEAGRWADRFLDEGDAAVEAFLSDYAHADRQRIRALIRKVRKADEAKTAEARRALRSFVETILKDIIP